MAGELEEFGKGVEDEWLVKSPLHVAAYTGDVNQLEALLEFGELFSFVVCSALNSLASILGIVYYAGASRTHHR